MESETTTQFGNYINEYIKQHDCYGANGWGDDAVAFVPRVALEGFWTEKKVVGILCRTPQEERIRADISQILNNYLVVFSVLVTLGKPQFITSFLSSRTALSDRELPFEGVPEEWTHDDEKRGTLEEFKKVQWKFCPLVFDQRLYKSVMSPYRIVPVTSKRLVDPDADEEEDDVLVYEANWHPDCLGFLPSSKVIFKEYRNRDPDVIATLENEIDIYTNLGEAAFDHIIRYFGSFEQQGKITIVLEYASEGDLVQFWAKTAPPTNTEEKLDLWNSFFRLLLGLDATHNLGSTEESEDRPGRWLLKGIHQDIRPQNILITGRDPGTYRIHFKLTDFGTGHVRRCRSQGLDTMGDQRRGNGMYSAPESYRDNNITRPQLCECDIWSLGGVASEFLVWCTRGDRRRQEYQQRRCEATGATVLAGGYHEGSFHNSEIRLQVVDDEHSTIDNSDIVSQVVSRIILGHMLIADVAHRSSAIKTYEQWTTALTFVRYQRRRPISRGDTRDSHYSIMSSLPKRQSVNSNYSLPQGAIPRANGDPWLHHDQCGGFSTEPVTMGSPSPWRMRGQSGIFSDHPEHGKRVDFAQEMGNGEGPSALYTLETDPSHWTRPGTHDSTRHASSIPSIPETGKMDLVSQNPIKSAPSFPVHSSTGKTVHRTPTGLSVNSSLASPPPSFHRRTTADEFHSVAEVEYSSPPNQPTGLGLNMDSEATNHILSPPSTPKNKTTGNRRSLDTPGRSDTESPGQAPRIRRAPTTITEAAKITIDNVYEKIFSSEKGKSKFSPWKAKPDLLAESPRLADAVTRLKGLNGREQVFIIDDSQSMLQHRHEIARTLRVLARLLKVGGVDPDKHFTVYYACTLRKVSLKHATDLEKNVLEHVFSNGPCNFGVQLDEIVSDLPKSRNPVSIYVLTNGHWNAELGKPEDLCGVDSVIERILGDNKTERRQKNHVGFQFIRFYRHAKNVHDDEGKQRLDILDNGLAVRFKKLGMPKSDIIDTTNWDEDVPKMLLGGVFTEEDDVITVAAGQPVPSERT